VQYRLQQSSTMPRRTRGLIDVFASSLLMFEKKFAKDGSSLSVAVTRKIRYKCSLRKNKIHEEIRPFEL
jgi:hypothetical protein